MFSSLLAHDMTTIIKIIIIDILLGGDNAIVIALVCRGLPQSLRFKGIVLGTIGAIILRLILLLVALELLQITGLKLIGGLLLIGIAIKIMLPEKKNAKGEKIATTLIEAVTIIAIMDMIMSLDNVLAISAAVQNNHPDHQFNLVLFGILVSIPIIIWGSTIILKLLDRYPILIAAGAGLLGWIAADMVMADQLTHYLTNNYIEINSFVIYSVKIITVIFVILIGYLLAIRRKKSYS